MKKIIFAVLLLISIRSSAQFPIAAIIKAGVKKVIVAVDLKIQQLQNKTIWLQNAQKLIENQLSKLKLSEIADWANKQKELYRHYFEELRKVKLALTYYHRVKDIIGNQVAMVAEYKAAWAVFRQDKNFSAEELDYMSEVYEGMLQESVKLIDQLRLVVQSFTVQMTDARRMEIIRAAAAATEQHFLDLKEFNQQQQLVSVQRSAAKGEIEYVKRLYGIPPKP